MSAAELAYRAEQFGISTPTLRVALTRAVNAGDLRRVDGQYALGERLAARQRRQDEGVEVASTPWDGQWRTIIVVASARPASERIALRKDLTSRRFAELREGVWLRPDNLDHGATAIHHTGVALFRGVPDDDPRALASSLWDLSEWARQGHQLLDLLQHTQNPALRLAAAAKVVRHLTDDPLLPVDLLPPHWPGDLIRRAYADYRRELLASAPSSPPPSVD